MILVQSPQGYILRLMLGEDLHATLTAFCEQHHIRAGIFHGIGAVQRLTLAFYHLGRKEYQDTSETEDLEIVGLTGNVAMLDGKPFLHIHGVFSDRYYRVLGGHVRSAIVGATCEVYLTPFDTVVRREHDDVTGLKLCAFDPPADGSPDAHQQP